MSELPPPLPAPRRIVSIATPADRALDRLKIAAIRYMFDPSPGGREDWLAAADAVNALDESAEGEMRKC